MTRANSSTDFGAAKRITFSGVANSARAIKPSVAIGVRFNSTVALGAYWF